MAKPKIISDGPRSQLVSNVKCHQRLIWPFVNFLLNLARIILQEWLSIDAHLLKYLFEQMKQGKPLGTGLNSSASCSLILIRPIGVASISRANPPSPAGRCEGRDALL